MPAPLSDLVVLEISGDVATRYCGKLFAENGARVIQTYRPDDSRIGYAGTAARAYAVWLDAGKERPPAADQGAEAGTAKEVGWAMRAGILPAVVIAGQTPSEIAHATAVVAGFPCKPLLLAVTWFGDAGPYAGWSGRDGVIQAMTGIAYAFGPSAGPPTLPQGHAPQIIAGATGLIVALAALIGRRAATRLIASRPTSWKHISASRNTAARAFSRAVPPPCAAASTAISRSIRSPSSRLKMAGSASRR